MFTMCLDSYNANGLNKHRPIETAMPEKVQVYIYDVTQGMAKMLSPMLLGRQIDGVWHSAIYVYGNEYFFGGGGISYCPPAGTILGPPTQVVDLGDTEIPFEMFMDFLVQLSEDRFRGDQYHLLRHNCNNFSDEVAQFLTGESIPSHVVGLPAEVLSTPFGQQIQPIIEQMMSQMHGTTEVHAAGNSSAPAAASGGTNLVAQVASAAAAGTKPINAKPSKPNNAQFKHHDDELD